MFFQSCVQHAHVSRGEVIGLLGGTFNKEEEVLKVGGDLGSFYLKYSET